jgi:hypothetical protein
MNWFTFIGTGVGWISTTASGNAKNITVAQNLPYGTHILKMNRSGNNELFAIDGVAISGTAFGTYGSTSELTVHQPKMPPIPDDAVVIADYMLMADYVANVSNGNHLISKGVRAVSQTRDVFYEEIGGFVFSIYDSGAFPGMGYLASSSSSTNSHLNKYSLPAFGTTFQVNGHTSQSANDLFIDGGDVAQSGTSSGNHGDISYPDAAVTLGLHKFAVHGASSRAYSPYLGGLGFKIATPIHTSSHYQYFETPFLYELVGGDRNMEQTNLVVTPDGKTWDEATRNTSYMGNASFSGNSDGYTQTSASTLVKLTDFRGVFTNAGTMFNKHFAIAYDRLICLYDGQYHITMHNETYGSGNRENILWINGYAHTRFFEDGATPTATGWNATVNLLRGQEVWMTGVWGTNRQYTQFQIHKI